MQWIMSDSQQNSAIVSDNSQPIIPTVILAYHLILRALFAVGSIACIPVLDGLTLAQLEREGRDKQEYGKERAYGAISWGIAHILSGPAIDMFGFKTLYGTVVLAFIGCIVTFQLYAKSISTIEYNEVCQKTEYIDDLAYSSDDEEKKCCDEASPMLQNPQQESQYQSIPDSDDYDKLLDNSNAQSTSEKEYQEQSRGRMSFTQLIGFFFKETPILNMSYMICVFALFVGMSVVENLIFLYFEFLGGTNTMSGFTVIVTVIIEIPLFQNAPKVLKRLGYTCLLQLACLAYVVRVIGYSFIPTSHPYLVLFLEPLHGITIAFAFTSCVAFADQNVPSGYESSGQGFMSMIRSFGMFVGLCIGGFVEGRALYRLLALIVALGSLALGIGTYSAMKSQKLSNQSSTSGEQST